ncbi:MAG: hypothetical protein V1799_07495 [bacterium]
MFEVRWTKIFATNLFGQFVQSGASIRVTALRAIELHDSNEGWVCDDIEAARKSISATDLTITETDLTKQLTLEDATIQESLGDAFLAPQIEASDDELGQNQPAFTLVSDQGLNNAESPANASSIIKCPHCDVAGFTSKKKLNAHILSVHPNG